MHSPIGDVDICASAVCLLYKLHYVLKHGVRPGGASPKSRWRVERPRNFARFDDRLSVRGVSERCDAAWSVLGIMRKIDDRLGVPACRVAGAWSVHRILRADNECFRCAWRVEHPRTGARILNVSVARVVSLARGASAEICS